MVSNANSSRKYATPIFVDRVNLLEHLHIQLEQVILGLLFPKILIEENLMRTPYVKSFQS